MRINRSLAVPPWLACAVVFGVVGAGAYGAQGADMPAGAAPDTTVASTLGPGSVPASPSAEPADGPSCEPLEERVTVNVAAALKGEFTAPVLLADHFGEFDAENIDLNFEQIPTIDALPLMAQEEIDVRISGWNAGAFNAVSSGINIKWVMGLFTQGDSRQGLWVRRDFFTTPDDPDLAELANASIANHGLLGGSTVGFVLSELLGGHGVDAADLEVVDISAPDMYVALENGAVDGAWIFDPFWVEVEEDGDYIFVGGQPLDYSLGSVDFGPTLLESRPEVGDAFTRAYIRAQLKYLDGDYHADDELVQLLSEQMGVSVPTIRAVPSLDFNYEVSPTMAVDLQEFYGSLPGDILLGEVLPDERVVDRTFYERAETCLEEEGLLDG